MDQFEEMQDTQVVKFLKKRYEFISIDMNYVKTNINIQSFKNLNDQILLIMIIILLKNANNLILELGSLSFMQFLRDVKVDLISKMDQDIQKTAQARQIIEGFDIFHDEQNGPSDHGASVPYSQKISLKVQKLIEILNAEASKTQKVPKVIIFVKDRVMVGCGGAVPQEHPQGVGEGS